MLVGLGVVARLGPTSLPPETLEVTEQSSQPFLVLVAAVGVELSVLVEEMVEFTAVVVAEQE